MITVQLYAGRKIRILTQVGIIEHFHEVSFMKDHKTFRRGPHSSESLKTQEYYQGSYISRYDYSSLDELSACKRLKDYQKSYILGVVSPILI